MTGLRHEEPPSLQPQPPLRRSSMVARPWAGSPWRRFFAALSGRSRQTHEVRDGGDARPLMLRRIVLLALVLLGAFVGTRAMAEVLPEHGASLAEQALLVLFGILFAWISAGFWTGVMGAVVLVRGRGRHSLVHGIDMQAVRPLAADARTAIVMPICNEHVATVFGGLSATIDSLIATGEAGQFDVFVLSDTGEPGIRAAEQAAWTALRRRLAATAGSVPRVHYRWRQLRTKRKAGNVADFCRRWGAAYRYMVVLDADSIMTGECLTTLVRVMEARPDAGIVQTAPRAAGLETVHARVQQFSARAYGPLFTAGMRFWQLGESHYWGHNAIIRVAPFIRHCALAPIAGSGSLSGEILSHDFVEAALMRRAGWKVWVADEIEGSYEQVPPNLVAELQRDRRWCHGNLQNSRLLFEPRMHAVHRTAFLTGVLAYASAPLWLGFLLLSTLLFAQHAGSEPAYFIEPYQLFPIWPTANLRLMLTLFGLTGVLLLAPKALSLLAIVLRGEARRFGGVPALLGGALIEFLHSLFLAPVRMLFHSQFVVAAITGWRLDWKSPPRDDASTGWREAWRRHGAHTLFALAWIGVILASSDAFPWWLSPILLGLLFAMPISVYGSRVSIGRALRRRSLLATPEELRTPHVLGEAARAVQFADPIGDKFAAAVVDADVQSLVVAALPRRAAVAGAADAKSRSEAHRVDRAIAAGPAALSRDDRLRLLSSAPALAQVHAAVAGGRAHRDWAHAAAARPDAGAALDEDRLRSASASASAGAFLGHMPAVKPPST